MEVMRENAAHHFCMNDDVERAALAEGENVVLLEGSFHTSRMGVELKNVKHLLLLDPVNGLVNGDKKRTADDADNENHRANGQSQLEQIGLGVGQFINRVEQHKETKDGPNNEGGDKDGGHVGYYYGRFL